MSFEENTQKHYNFLLEEYKRSENSQEIDKLAMSVIGKMVEREDLTEPNDVLEKLAELRQQTSEDLKVLEKAVELGRNPVIDEATKVASASLGSLSEKSNEEDQDNLTKFLLEDY